MGSRFARQNVEGDAATLNFGDEFTSAHCLLNSEVQLLLEDLHQKRNSDTTFIPLPPISDASNMSPYLANIKIEKLSEKYGSTHFDSMALFTYGGVGFCRTMTTDESLAEYEMAQIGNLCPETAEEAKSIIPSLQTKKNDDQIQRLLDDLAAARQFQS